MAGTVRGLADAIRALLPATVTLGSTVVSVKTHDTSTGSTTPPADNYFVLAVRVPSVLERSEGASPVGHEVSVRLTAVGRNVGSVRDLAQSGYDALDRATVLAAGWVPGILLERNTRGPEEDPDVVFTGGTRAIFAVSEFVLTTSRTA